LPRLHEFIPADADHVQLVEARLNGTPCFIFACNASADIEDIGRGTRGDVGGKSAFGVWLPNGIGIRSPGIALQKGVEDNICIKK
jgi:hypothetical protein